MLKKILFTKRLLSKGVIFMKKNVKTLPVTITKFISTKDKTKTIDNFPMLLKEGGVTEFFFLYVKNGDKSNVVHNSQRIVKLDLYNKEVYTTEENLKYKILNEF